MPALAFRGAIVESAFLCSSSYEVIATFHASQYLRMILL